MQAACVAVAYSGGRDSTALLHATLAATRGTTLRVLALHVHHGLQAQADEWLRHCAATCRRWARDGVELEFDSRRLEGRPGVGESIEAWARHERYRALADMAQSHGAAAVLLAHHQRDQAETLLLQALRGGGVAGLAAMPRGIERDGLTWLRPWLTVSHAAIAAYVKRHRLRHIDDRSNQDSRFARNRLRSAVWPVLTAAFPQAESSLAMASRWSQEAATVLAEVAQQDLTLVADGDGLQLAAWRELSPARRRNALRAWVAAASGQAAPASLIERLMVELGQAARGARWQAAGGELRRHRGFLRYVETTAAIVSPSYEVPLAITRAGHYRVAQWGGSLHAIGVSEKGIALPRLAAMRAVPRQGGEAFNSGRGGRRGP